MIKYNTYKTVSKVSLYGDDDELLNNPQSVYKTNNSSYKNCKKVKFNLNGSFNHLNQLSNNARLMLESSFIQGEQPLIPNLWCKFDTGAILTNSGTDNITLTNINGVTNANIYVIGNNSASFNGTNQYLTGTNLNLTGFGSFSISVWIYLKVVNAGAYNIICQFYKTGGLFWINFQNSYKYEFGMAGFNIVTNSTYQNDLNNWVHLVATYNYLTKQVLLYRNGVYYLQQVIL